MEVPEAMGSAIAINIQSTGAGKIAATGDFVLTGDEVNPVIKALRDNQIEVTALHNHMINEEPRTFFMHFWANDEAGQGCARSPGGARPGAAGRERAEEGPARRLQGYSCEPARAYQGRSGEMRAEGRVGELTLRSERIPHRSRREWVGPAD